MPTSLRSLPIIIKVSLNNKLSNYEIASSIKTIFCLFILHYIIIKLKRALIGQSAMVYCAGKPMEISRVSKNS